MLLITLIMHDHFTGLHVGISPNTTSAALGQFVNFTCTATYSVPVTVAFEWKLNSNLLTSDGYLTIIEPSGSCSGVKCNSTLHLKIPESGFTSQSTITCSVRVLQSDSVCTTFAGTSANSTFSIGSQCYRYIL